MLCQPVGSDKKRVDMVPLSSTMSDCCCFDDIDEAFSGRLRGCDIPRAASGRVGLKRVLLQVAPGVLRVQFSAAFHHLLVDIKQP